jgi:heat shock protein HslJ
LAALATLLAAFGTMPVAAESPSLDGTAWVLSGLPGGSLLEGTMVTAHFAGGRVSGTDGCNRYSGSYSIKGTALDVSTLASTQMACVAEVNAQARAYAAALTNATSYRIVGDRLELLSADGRTSAEFAAQSLLIKGTRWRATGINNGKQAVASVVKGSLVTLSFGADGRASGSAGCNQYAAPYQSAGASLSFGQAAVTRKMCARPGGVMEQEQQFLKALSTVTTARFEGDRLELRTGEGALAVTLVRADDG